jgi:hypothetical protein
MWPDQYSWTPKSKYEAWLDELFYGDRVLSQPVYAEVLPWLNDNLVRGEQNLIMLASRLYGDKLLNTKHFDGKQTTRQEKL